MVHVSEVAKVFNANKRAIISAWSRTKEPSWNIWIPAKKADVLNGEEELIAETATLQIRWVRGPWNKPDIAEVYYGQVHLGDVLL